MKFPRICHEFILHSPPSRLPPWWPGKHTLFLKRFSQHSEQQLCTEFLFDTLNSDLEHAFIDSMLKRETKGKICLAFLLEFCNQEKRSRRKLSSQDQEFTLLLYVLLYTYCTQKGKIIKYVLNSTLIRTHHIRTSHHKYLKLNFLSFPNLWEIAFLLSIDWGLDSENCEVCFVLSENSAPMSPYFF